MSSDAQSFPNHVRAAQLPRIPYSRLLENDRVESQRMFQACIHDGFFLLNLSESEDGLHILRLVKELYSVGKDFFQQEARTKSAFELRPGNIGYMPLGAIKDPSGRGGNVEICSASQDSILATEHSALPEALSRRKPLLQASVKALHPVTMLLLEHLAKHLKVPKTSFTDLHRQDVQSTTVLRFLHYPPQPHVSQQRAGILGHSDSNSITLLFAKVGGWQVLPAFAHQDDETAWQWVQPDANCAIVNLGDPMVQWSGGVLRSAYHRVFPGPGEHAHSARYSVGYFLKPQDDAPMKRFQEGNVIPRLSGDEVAASPMGYLDWHKRKTTYQFAGGYVPRNAESVFVPEAD